jgi:hypothetical protein
MKLIAPLAPSDRVWEAVIDQHDTWVAVNPVQGCPKSCGYCYLQDRGQTLVKPVELATPRQTVALLTASPYYHQEAALALYTCTDALATPRNQAHLTGLLTELARAELRNPVCLITKCAVTDDVLAAILDARTAGIPVVVYLSYSGLGPDIEQGINHQQLRDNFPRLHDHGIPVIHYWRPLMPANSTPQSITAVMDWAAGYAACTIAVGLKVKPGARDQMIRLWPDLVDDALPLETADAVWPRSTWDALKALPERYPHHPIYHTNSCALAYVLSRPDHHQVHTTASCTANHCPPDQRRRCAAATTAPVTSNAIQDHLVWLGVPTPPRLVWDAGRRTAIVQDPLALRDSHNTAQRFNITIRASRAEYDTYWTGRLEGGAPLIIDSK